MSECLGISPFRQTNQVTFAMKPTREHRNTDESFPRTLRRCESMARVGPYRGYAEILVQLEEFVAQGAREVPIGQSVRGAPLTALEIGPEDGTDITVVVGGVHAMEWIGVEVLMAALQKLTAHPPTSHRVLVVPVVNVDGYLQVESDLRAGQRCFRRGNANGVDLNRNWPTHFKRRPGRTPLRKWLGNSGDAACSEPEVSAVVEFLKAEETRGGTIKRALSLHSFGRALLHPFGGRWRPPGDKEAHVALAGDMNEHLLRKYRVVQCARWFPGFFAHGMEIDHFHDAFGALSLLMECSGGGLRWSDPSSWFHPFRWFNPSDPAPVINELAPAVAAFCAKI